MKREKEEEEEEKESLEKYIIITIFLQFSFHNMHSLQFGDNKEGRTKEEEG